MEKARLTGFRKRFLSHRRVKDSKHCGRSSNYPKRAGSKEPSPEILRSMCHTANIATQSQRRWPVLAFPRKASHVKNSLVSSLLVIESRIRTMSRARFGGQLDDDNGRTGDASPEPARKAAIASEKRDAHRKRFDLPESASRMCVICESPARGLLSPVPKAESKSALSENEEALHPVRLK